MTLIKDLQFFGWDDVKGEGGSDKKKVEFVKFAPNKPITIRILDEEPFSRWSHWVQSVQRSLTCLGKNCPICSIIRDQKANGETPKYASSKRHAILIWNYETKRVEVLDAGNEVFQQLSVFNDNIGDVCGYDLKVIRTGEAKNTKYQFLPQAPKGVTLEISEAYCAYKADFDFKEYYKALTYEQTVMILEGKTLEEVFADTKKEDVPFEETSEQEVTFELEE